MLFIREFTVRKHERGLLLRNGDFVRFLAPAVYRFFDPQRRFDVERFDLSQPAFEHRLVDYLVRWQPEATADLFLRVETGANQIAVITRNGHPWSVVGPECRALFWKGVVHVTAEFLDISEDCAVAPRIARAIAAARGAQRHSAFEQAVLLREVPEAHVGLLYMDGRLVSELPPGLHAFWRFDRNIAVELCDQRLKTLDLCSPEVVTGDNASVRVAVSADYRIGNAQLVARAAREPQNLLHRELQAALRATVGGRTFDTLLGNKIAVGEEVLARAKNRVALLGIELRDVEVKDVQLLDEPPAGLRLRELEALERLTAKVGTVSVVGDLTGVLNELVRLKL